MSTFAVQPDHCNADQRAKPGKDRQRNKNQPSGHQPDQRLKCPDAMALKPGQPGDNQPGGQRKGRNGPGPNAFKTIKDPIIKEKLKEATKNAHEKEVFGAPTFIVNNKIFWGQDRLEFALDEYKNN